jgi:hypothetical protein
MLQKVLIDNNKQKRCEKKEEILEIRKFSCETLHLYKIFSGKSSLFDLLFLWNHQKLITLLMVVSPINIK